MCSCSERRWSEGRDQGVVEICVGLVDDERGASLCWLLEFEADADGRWVSRG
ncbi:hypothetical protein Droror1_Dr00025567, partial [Drosera rotundifolia]